MVETALQPRGMQCSGRGQVWARETTAAPALSRIWFQPSAARAVSRQAGCEMPQQAGCLWHRVMSNQMHPGTAVPAALAYAVSRRVCEGHSVTVVPALSIKGSQAAPGTSPCSLGACVAQLRHRGRGTKIVTAESKLGGVGARGLQCSAQVEGTTVHQYLQLRNVRYRKQAARGCHSALLSHTLATCCF